MKIRCQMKSWLVGAVLGGLALAGCGKKEEPAVNTPWDKSQLPAGAYDMDKMKGNMNKGQKDGDK